jgi:hypothetical protein
MSSSDLYKALLMQHLFGHIVVQRRSLNMPLKGQAGKGKVVLMFTRMTASDIEV